MGKNEWLLYVALAGLSWGTYVPFIAYGGKELSGNRFGALLCVGIAYVLVGLLRALPFHAAQRRLMLPAEAMRAVSLSQEQIFSGTMDVKVTALFAVVAMRARKHLEAAQKFRVARAHLPALLPAALSPLYLKRMIRAGFNPFRDSTDVAVHRRQLALLAAMLRRRV